MRKNDDKISLIKVKQAKQSYYYISIKLERGTNN